MTPGKFSKARSGRGASGRKAPAVKTRKQLRKEQRRQKKANRALYYERKSLRKSSVAGEGCAAGGTSASSESPANRKDAVAGGSFAKGKRCFARSESGAAAKDFVNGESASANSKSGAVRKGFDKRKSSAAKEEFSQAESDDSVTSESCDERQESVRVRRSGEKKNFGVEKGAKAERRRIAQLKDENSKEEREIKRLEKRLKLNKRKSKTTPQSFVKDGLDYILDFCEEGDRSRLLETEKQILDSDAGSEFDEDLNMIMGADASETRDTVKRRRGDSDSDSGDEFNAAVALDAKKRRTDLAPGQNFSGKPQEDAPRGLTGAAKGPKGKIVRSAEAGRFVRIRTQRREIVLADSFDEERSECEEGESAEETKTAKRKVGAVEDSECDEDRIRGSEAQGVGRFVRLRLTGDGQGAKGSSVDGDSDGCLGGPKSRSEGQQRAKFPARRGKQAPRCSDAGKFVRVRGPEEDSEVEEGDAAQDENCGSEDFEGSSDDSGAGFEHPARLGSSEDSRISGSGENLENSESLGRSEDSEDLDSWESPEYSESCEDSGSSEGDVRLEDESLERNVEECRGDGGNLKGGAKELGETWDVGKFVRRKRGRSDSESENESEGSGEEFEDDLDEGNYGKENASKSSRDKGPRKGNVCKKGKALNDSVEEEEIEESQLDEENEKKITSKFSKDQTLQKNKVRKKSKALKDSVEEEEIEEGKLDEENDEKKNTTKSFKDQTLPKSKASKKSKALKDSVEEEEIEEGKLDEENDEKKNTSKSSTDQILPKSKVSKKSKALKDSVEEEEIEESKLDEENDEKKNTSKSSTDQILPKNKVSKKSKALKDSVEEEEIEESKLDGENDEKKNTTKSSTDQILPKNTVSKKSKALKDSVEEEEIEEGKLDEENDEKKNTTKSFKDQTLPKSKASKKSKVLKDSVKEEEIEESKLDGENDEKKNTTKSSTDQILPKSKVSKKSKVLKDSVEEEEIEENDEKKNASKKSKDQSLRKGNTSKNSKMLKDSVEEEESEENNFDEENHEKKNTSRKSKDQSLRKGNISKNSKMLKDSVEEEESEENNFDEENHEKKNTSKKSKDQSLQRSNVSTKNKVQKDSVAEEIEESNPNEENDKKKNTSKKSNDQSLEKSNTNKKVKVQKDSVTKQIEESNANEENDKKKNTSKKSKDQSLQRSNTSKKVKVRKDSVAEEIEEAGRNRDSDVEGGDEAGKNLETETAGSDDECWEDIYGRRRDKDGNVVRSSSKYVPPAARAANSQSEDSRLRRQLKGLINRLAEHNMHTISTQIEELYMSNSRNAMNEVLSSLILEAVVCPILTPDRMIAEHMMLIAILHANVGVEVGAHFLLTVVRKIDDGLRQEQTVENKEMDNMILMLAHMYNFKIYGHKLLYQILAKLTEKFTEKEIDLILLTLRSVGFPLRKDDPAALKELILTLQQKASNVTSNNRVKFMLDVLLAIKNNNVSKIPQYDPSHVEHLKKLTKSFLRKGNSVTQFNISLEDLLHANERGKWWVIGSAWSGTEVDRKQEAADRTPMFSQRMLELARKQRMNTDVRRNIFCVIMNAEDYLDAFEKLHRLGLKDQQERELIYVLMDCCLQEKSFNPYYAVLAQKFCDFDRRFQMTIQYTLWDKLKALDELGDQQLSNLARFLTFLFVEKSLPFSVLKVVQFAELDKRTMRLLRQIILGILLHKDAEACAAVFERISASPKLQQFREGLRLFVSHFLVKNAHKSDALSEKTGLLKARADLVDKILVSRANKATF